MGVHARADEEKEEEEVVEEVEWGRASGESAARV
jgi:hypothetical protein